MKKPICVLLTLVVILAAAGCGGSGPEPGTVPADAPETAPAGEMAVLDRDGNRLGGIDARAACTAVDGGVFYSLFQLPENAYIADAEYRFFDMDTGRDVPLGTLEGQGYEAVYTRTELGGKIYTLAVVGNPMSEDPVRLVLLEADPAAGTMERYTVSENGFPYASMAVCGKKLLIMDHEMTNPKRDKIYAFDPGTGKVRDVLTFDPAADSLRGVCAAEEGFFLLRLKIGGSNELFLDRYDAGFAKVSEQSVNEMMLSAVTGIHGIAGRQDAQNELGMSVSRFAVEDDRYLIYENFGLTRLLIDLETGEALLAEDDVYSVTVGSGVPFFYRMDLDPENAPAPDITGIVGGERTTLDFQPAADHPLICGVSHSAGGTWLVMTYDGASAPDRTFALCIWTET